MVLRDGEVKTAALGIDKPAARKVGPPESCTYKEKETGFRYLEARPHMA